jgi:thioredoxin-like negative regulator of GroEL
MLMAMRIREMNDYDLMRAISDSGRPVVTAFVERGVASRPIESTFGDLADDFQGALFTVVDIAENPAIARRFCAVEAPCAALFRDGKHLGTITTLTRPELAAFIERTLKS